jgi:hypothetical protein
MTVDSDEPVQKVLNRLSRGDDWPFHYRGYKLSANEEGELWWNAYKGTGRLKLDPLPTNLVEDLISIDRTGGSIRVTESGHVITKVEENSGSNDRVYQPKYVGEIDFTGVLKPQGGGGDPVNLAPMGLSPGDLWPSVYDGSKYSFQGERFWWSNPEDKYRYPFAEELPTEVRRELRDIRPRGGSFRITPSRHVITQIETQSSPPNVRKQFRSLPDPVKRILKLRRDRGGVERIPVYVGRLDEDYLPVTLEEPTRLSDPLSEREEAELEGWAAALNEYEREPLSEDDHTLDSGGDEL